MAIVLSTPPFTVFYDDNGNPLTGGKVFTYTAGTLTPRVTYTDQGGLTSNANPVILDSAGRAAIWLDNAFGYKFIVHTSADVLLSNGTIDNITPFNTSSSSGLANIGSIAANTIIGNNTGSSAIPTALTVAQVNTLLSGSATGVVLISTQTISSPVASVDFTSGINGTYSRYLLTITGLRSSTNTVELRTRFYRSAAWLTTSDYSGDCVGRGGGFDISASAAAATAFAILSSANSMTLSNDTARAFGLNIEFGNTTDAALSHSIGYRVWGGAGSATVAMGVGRYEVAGALEGIQFYASSGNLAGGTFKLYGMV